MAEDQFQMTGRQQLVHRSLKENKASIAVLYEAALRVLSDESNPANFLFAAHSIRMMMDDLPKVLVLPVLAEQGRLGDQVSKIEPIWNRALKSSCHQNGEWNGAIDGPLQKFLIALDNLLGTRQGRCTSI
jgi:hypothetical protein